MLNKFHLSIVNFSKCTSFLWLLIIFEMVNSTIEHDNFYLDTHRTEKQMSLESCLGRFDVHGNTIIRTGESQAIGGKFLQGLELETPEKCQRLCCETEDCDVYVFEEKNDGYCYLFQCGSPKNFHCKFTRHSNYTSALLTQFKSTLTSTPRPEIHHLTLANMSTQELELINLKAKPEKYLITSTLPTAPVANDNGLLAVVPVENRNFSCGRFEFACHSGECIAVYNACNGIPQCVDGSDEGPECSEAANSKSNTNYQENGNGNSKTIAEDNRHNFKKIEKTIIDSMPIVENRQPTHLVDNQEHHTGVPGFSDTNTGILSNTDKAHNVLDEERPRGKLLPNQREMYIQPSEGKSFFSTPQIAKEKAHIFNENSKWPTQQAQQSYITHEPPYSSYYQPSNSLARKKQLHVLPQNEETLNVGPKIFNEDLPAKSKFQNNVDYVEKPSDYADYQDKPIIDNTNKNKILKKDEVSLPANSVQKEPHSGFVEQFKVIEQHLEIKFSDHDGFSEKPKGAVLSLTLGLMVTAVILVLIICRLRTVGRRINRHGGKVPYAPDEDFLVNGMYL